MSNGYTKDKADKAIAAHDEQAARYTVASRVVGDPQTKEALEQKAAAETSKSENLRELERHHGDAPPGPRRITDTPPTPQRIKD